MIFTIFIIIAILIYFYMKKAKASNCNKNIGIEENIHQPLKKIRIKPSIKLEELELSKNYKKIIFFSSEQNNQTSYPSYIVAIKMGFNLKTGDLIHLEEYKDIDDLEKFNKFSEDTKHIVFHNMKLDNYRLRLDSKILFCTMLTNKDIVEIKNINKRDYCPELSEIAKYYGIKYNNQLGLDSLKKLKLNIQIFQKMLKDPKGSIFVRDFIFNDNSYLT